MKPETISSLKKELKSLSAEELQSVCLRLTKYKVENKELLTYLLFYEQDKEAYLQKVKEEVEFQFGGINQANLYWAKKGIRKILRLVNKHIKYISEKSAEVDLLIHYCEILKNSGIPFQRSVSLFNLYERQIFKIEKAISALHEDLQFDWNMALDDKKLRMEYF